MTKLGTITVSPLEDLESTVDCEKVELAILAVPASSAAIVAQRLEDAGVTARTSLLCTSFVWYP